MALAALNYEGEAPMAELAGRGADEAGAQELDFAHLAHQTLNDVALECEILSLFVVQSQVYLLRLQAAESMRDWQRAVHTLKGSARGVGAWKLARAAEVAEGLGPDLHDEAHREALRELLERVSATNAAVRERMSCRCA